MYTIEEIANPLDFKGLQVGDVVFVSDYYKQLIGNVDSELYADVLDSIDRGSEFPFSAAGTKYRYAVKVHKHEQTHPFTKETFLPYADKWLRCKLTGDLYKPTCITGTYVVLDRAAINYEQLLIDYVFNDGSPCGVIK